MIFPQLQTEHNSQIVGSFHLAIQSIIVGERSGKRSQQNYSPTSCLTLITMPGQHPRNRSWGNPEVTKKIQNNFNI